jgi:hypothetical protein
MEKMIIILTHFIVDSPSTCPLKERKDLTSQASSKHFLSAHCILQHQNLVSALEKFMFIEMVNQVISQGN